MKELSIEQKAQAYDKALERAESFELPEYKNIMASVFPELKESKDERIRKWIIKQIKTYDPSNIREKALAWLEKQDEEEYALKSSKHEDVHKFKVGDWIVQENIGTYKVIEVCESWYEVIENRDNRYSIGFDKEYMCHLWTIQDAKDGDVLATSAGAFIYNGNNGGGSCPGSYCGIDNLGEFKTGAEHHWTGKKVYPATIEQRNLLFQKIHEAGYMWDSESKQLLSLKAEPIGEQKPVELSEDDKIRLNNLIWLVEQSEENAATKKRFIDFINRLKSMLC